MAAQVNITIHTPAGDTSIDQEDRIIRADVPDDVAAARVLAAAVRRAIGAVTLTPERRSETLAAFLAEFAAEAAQ